MSVVLEYLTVIPVVVKGVSWFVNYEKNFFTELVNLVFVELCNLDISKEELNMLVEQVRSMCKYKGKKMGKYRMFRVRRKYIKLMKQMLRLRTMVNKEVFTELVERGDIIKYFVSIEKLQEFYYLIKKTSKITGKTWNFINVCDIESPETIKEYNELYVSMFRKIELDKNNETINMFNEVIDKYVSSKECKEEMMERQKKLISLLSKHKDNVKSKKLMTKLESLISMVNDIELDNFFKMEEVGENTLHNSVNNSSRIGQMLSDKMEILSSIQRKQMFNEEQKLQEDLEMNMFKKTENKDNKELDKVKFFGI